VEEAFTVNPQVDEVLPLVWNDIRKQQAFGDYYEVLGTFTLFLP